VNDKVVRMYVCMYICMYVCTLPLDTCAGAIFQQNVLNVQIKQTCMRFQVMVETNVLDRHGTIV